MHKKILIVDDNIKFTKDLSWIINSFCSGFIEKLLVAHSPEECLDILSKHHFDIVFMDYEIPGMNGAKLASMINRENRFTKIIAISFHSEDQYIEEMINSGARDYLVKDNIDAMKIIEIIGN